MKSHKNMKKKLLLKELEGVGVGSVEVTYDGSGDEGQITEVTAYERSDVTKVKKKLGTYRKDSNEMSIKDVTITWTTKKGSWSNQKWSESEVTKKIPLEEAIQDFCYDLLETTGFDWANNGGGYGTITIDTDTGKIHLDHRQRIISEEQYEKEF